MAHALLAGSVRPSANASMCQIMRERLLHFGRKEQLAMTMRDPSLEHNGNIHT